MADDNTQTVEVDAKEGRFKVSGSNILNLLTFIMVVLLCYGGFMHEVSAGKESAALSGAIKESAAIQTAAIKESSQNQREMVNALREQNCFNWLTPQERSNPDRREYCKQQGKGR